MPLRVSRLLNGSDTRAFRKGPSVAGKNLLVAPDVPGVTLNPTMCTLLDGTARHHEPQAAFIA